MRRRRFLATVAVASATLPSWLRRAFADASLVGGSAGPLTVAEAQSLAKRERRPLVAFVVPDDDSGKYQRGRLLGEFVMNASEAQLVPLAGCAVAAIPVADLRAQGLVRPGETPLFVRLEPSGESTAVAATGVPAEPRGMRGDNSSDDEKLIDSRIAFVAQRLAEVSDARDKALVQRRSLMAAALLSADERARIDGAGDARAIAALPLPLLVRGAPLLQARALDATPSVRNAIQQALGSATAAQLRTGRIAGSYWAQSSGCGPDHVEGLPERGEVVAVDCGMGHVPARSSRFLYFYTQTPSERRRAGR